VAFFQASMFVFELLEDLFLGGNEELLSLAEGKLYYCVRTDAFNSMIFTSSNFLIFSRHPDCLLDQQTNPQPQFLLRQILFVPNCLGENLSLE
jgi:hypothetical protein